MIPDETCEHIWSPKLDLTWIQRVVLYLERDVPPATLPDLTDHMHQAALAHDWDALRRLVKLADLRDRAKAWTTS